MTNFRPTWRYQERIAARLPRRLFARLHRVAEQHELRMSEIVRDALTEKVDALERTDASHPR